MAIYTVHCPPIADEQRKLAETQFVRDGFVYSAFVFGSFWLIAKRLWISAVVYALLVIGIWAMSIRLDLPLRVPFGISLLLAILLGLECSSLQRWRLNRRGWRQEGIVSAHGLEEAERRFFEQHGAAEPLADQPRSGLAPARAARDSGVLGLFPEPGARG